MGSVVPFGIFVLLTASSFCQGKFRFANFYGDHMVLQQAPRRAIVWGFGNVGQSVMLSLNGKVYTTKTAKSGQWRITLDAMSDNGPFTITAKSQNDVITLKDVLFGDVWVCSGQSNMVMTVSQIFRSKQELAMAANGTYSQVRLFQAAYKSSDKPLDEFATKRSWSSATPERIQSFSGLCWIYGRMLNDKLKRPIGLVQSAVGGTFIESWMSLQAKQKCPSSVKFGWFSWWKKAPPLLYNGMIHPLLKSTITGALWYQGESNALEANRNGEYKCQLPTMINDWRKNFHQSSGGQTSKTFPFGFVQLPGFRSKDITTGYTDLHWHSTAEFGDVPNPVLKNVFMSVAVDLPDPKSKYESIHPRFKTDIARRLYYGGIALAYGQKVQFRGPFPKSIHNDKDAKTITVNYKYGPIKKPNDLKSDEVGFEVCCAVTQKCNQWSKVNVTSYNSTAVALTYSCPSNTNAMALRYAWRETPCSLKHCLIYSVKASLPAPPFVFNLDQSSSVTGIIG